MAPSNQEVRSIFHNLSDSKTQPNFWARIADDVNWWIVGHTPMSGTYNSKQAFLDATMEILNGKVLDAPLSFRTVNVFGGGNDNDWATVEMEAIDAKCRNGMIYDMRYCWNVRFGESGLIEEVRAYVDTELLERAIKENK